MRHQVVLLALVVGLLAALALGQTKTETNSSSGSIQGVVFTTEQDGARSVVPGTKLSLDGPVHLQAESDPDGKVEFNAVTPGSYTITAEAPGLAATQNIEVRAGSVSQLELEMKVQAVTESTTVTASTEQVDTKESSGSPIIAQSTVAHAPNRNERFEDLLPLVPGVVRGPNGRINMKGARPSESGSLVNSADVTDPATGESAINIPLTWFLPCRCSPPPITPSTANSPAPCRVAELLTRAGFREAVPAARGATTPRRHLLEPGISIGLSCGAPRSQSMAEF